MKLLAPGLLSLCLACGAFGQDTARMDEVAQTFVKDGRFMGSALVARGGQVLFEKGYGSANLEWAEANTPTTRFRLGSLTKQFTAASILLLEERGLLRIEDPVAKYLPDAPAAWAKITIFHLLTHTSGIPSFTGFPDYAATERYPVTPEQLVARFRDKPLEFVPGENWRYDNSGYALLGYLIERVSGVPYAAFVQRNLFAPLGMKDSGYDSSTAIIPHRAAGYEVGRQGPTNTTFIDMTVPFAAGGLYSTTEDLLRWEQGLYGGKVLSAASLAKMTTPFKAHYAFGLGVGEDHGRKVFAHGGGIEGFQTWMCYFPAEQIAVVVLGNLDTDAPEKLGKLLSSLAFGEAVTLPAERKAITVAPEILQAYVGTYQLAPAFAIVVTLEEGQLVGQATNQPKFVLLAESPTRFFVRQVDAEVEFVAGAKGPGSVLILHQGGRDMPGPRI